MLFRSLAQVILLMTLRNKVPLSANPQYWNPWTQPPYQDPAGGQPPYQGGPGTTGWNQPPYQGGPGTTGWNQPPYQGGPGTTGWGQQSDPPSPEQPPPAEPSSPEDRGPEL